jgi:hypothetical protein
VLGDDSQRVEVQHGLVDLDADLLPERLHKQDQGLRPATDDEVQIGREVATVDAELTELD